jgi:RNA recognition motif-containing protein
MTIFVGNLNRSVREEELNNLFSEFGEIKQIKIIKDNYSGESKGFAFIDMMEENNATKAIAELNETELAGRKLAVSKAKPRENNRSGNNSYGNSNGNRNGNYNKKYNY